MRYRASVGTTNARTIDAFRNALIVSCQPSDLTPMRGSPFAAGFARAAEMGGARAVRVDGPEDVAAVKRAVSIPVVAIWTVVTDGCDVYITPNFRSARLLADAGADVIAIDGTGRSRPGDETVSDLIERIHADLGLPVEADIDSLKEAIAVREMGADMIGSSITGYVGTTHQREPDISLVRQLSHALDCPVIAQRHYWTLEHVRAAFGAGAHAVVVGSAITDPVQLTRRFVEGISTAR